MNQQKKLSVVACKNLPIWICNDIIIYSMETLKNPIEDFSVLSLNVYYIIELIFMEVL